MAEHVECEVMCQGKLGSAFFLRAAGPVFAKDNVEHAVQFVLDMPVVAAQFKHARRGSSPPSRACPMVTWQARHPVAGRRQKS